jgi:sugar lactone lactonase YvrE
LICAAAFAQQPRIDRISPSEGPISGGTIVTISGTNLTDASVTLDRGSITPLSRTDSEVRLQMPNHDNGYGLIQIGSAAAEYLYVPPKLEDLPPGYITTVAGVGKYIRLELPARQSMVSPWGLFALPNGDIYFVQAATHQVFRVSADGNLHHVAGTFGPVDFQFVGDGGPATAAVFIFPRDVAVDAAGNVYIPDAPRSQSSGGRVRKIDAMTGIISTIAGTGAKGSSSDGGTATQVNIGQPTHLTCSPDGTVYFLEDNVRVRKVTPNGIISTIAGNGTIGESGDSGPATTAQLDVGVDDVGQVAVDHDGNVFILETAGQRVRRVDAQTGVITTFASRDARGQAFTGGRGLAIDADGNVYVATQFNINKYDRTGRLTESWGSNHGFSDDGVVAKQALIGNPRAMAIAPNGDILYSDSSPWRMRRINVATGKLETVAGIAPNVIGVPGAALGARLLSAGALAFLPSGDLLYADSEANWIYRIDRRSGMISTFAGTGMFLGNYEESPALATTVSGPVSLDADSKGTVYFSDTLTIRSIDANGIVRRAVGLPPNYTFSGDGGPARNANLCQPWDITHDSGDNMYVADTNNNRIRRIDAQTGMIKTVAGSGASNGFEGYGHGSFCGDGGLATNACLNSPISVAARDDGTLYINESFRIRKVSPEGMITTLSGWPQTMKLIVGPGQSIFGHGLTKIYRADGDRVRTIAGGNQAGFSGDGGPATSALMDLGDGGWPLALAGDTEGNLFFAANNRVRAIRYGAVLAPPNATIQVTASGSTIRATVFDAEGRTAPGVRVDFTVPSAGPSCVLSKTFAITDPNGMAIVSCTPNCVEGTYSVTARPLASSSTASLSLTNAAGPCRRRSVRH